MAAVRVNGMPVKATKVLNTKAPKRIRNTVPQDRRVPSSTSLLVSQSSERRKEAFKTGAMDKAREKESAAINSSLTELGLVISKLAKEAAKKSGANYAHIPVRNSKLTYLLSDSLMGNSKTVMLATVSPAKCNLTQSEGTLRFADSVKQIKTKPVKNE